MIIWDLYASPDGEPNSDGVFASDGDYSSSRSLRPSALVIPFASPLCSVSSHPSTNKEFLVSDSRGTLYVIDWQREPGQDDGNSFEHPCGLQLVHPRALADAVSNLSRNLAGHASWHVDNSQM